MENTKNEMVVWSNTFACGIKILDAQHKILINIINDMFSHVTGSEKDEKDYLFDVVHHITDYIKLNFSTEEKIMLAAKYDGYLKHKKEHDDFILEFIDMVNEYLLGKKLTLFILTKYLKDWILSHISVMDKNYFKYYREIKEKIDLPAAASY